MKLSSLSDYLRGIRVLPGAEELINNDGIKKQGSRNSPEKGMVFAVTLVKTQRFFPTGRTFIFNRRVSRTGEFQQVTEFACINGSGPAINGTFARCVRDRVIKLSRKEFHLLEVVALSILLYNTK